MKLMHLCSKGSYILVGLWVIFVWTIVCWGDVPAPYQRNIIDIQNTKPGQRPIKTFSVTNTATCQPTNLQTDPAWTQANDASQLGVGELKAEMLGDKSRAWRVGIARPLFQYFLCPKGGGKSMP